MQRAWLWLLCAAAASQPASSPPFLFSASLDAPVPGASGACRHNFCHASVSGGARLYLVGSGFATDGSQNEVRLVGPGPSCGAAWAGPCVPSLRPLLCALVDVVHDTGGKDLSTPGQRRASATQIVCELPPAPRLPPRSAGASFAAHDPSSGEYRLTLRVEVWVRGRRALCGSGSTAAWCAAVRWDGSNCILPFRVRLHLHPSVP